MFEILKSLTFDDLPTKPEIVGKPQMSEDIQQTAALLVGWDGATRRLVSVSPSGVLYTASQKVKGIVNIGGGGVDYNWQGGDITTSEVLILANPSNSGRVWVNVSAVGGVDTGYPLDASHSVVWSINNLHTLHIHIVNSGEKAIVVYTK